MSKAYVRVQAGKCPQCGISIVQIAEHWELAHPVDPNYKPPIFSEYPKRGRPPKPFIRSFDAR